MIDDESEQRIEEKNKKSERDVKIFLQELKDAKIDYNNYMEHANQLGGIVPSLNTTINAERFRAKDLRSKFLPKLEAVNKEFKDRGEDISKCEPLGDIFQSQMDYIECLRDLAAAEMIYRNLMVEWASKLETALSQAKGTALTNEFLRRTEDYANKFIDKGLERIIISNERTSTKFIEALEKINRNIEQNTETTQKLVSKIEKIKIEQTILNPATYERKNKPSKEDDDIDDEEPDVPQPKKEEPVQNTTPIIIEVDPTKLRKEEQAAILEIGINTSLKKADKIKKMVRYVMEKHKSWGLNNVMEQIRETGQINREDKIDVESAFQEYDTARKTGVNIS